MLLSRSKGFGRNTLIRCRNKEGSLSKDNYKKGSQRSEYIFISECIQ